MAVPLIRVRIRAPGRIQPGAEDEPLPLGFFEFELQSIHVRIFADLGQPGRRVRMECFEAGVR